MPSKIVINLPGPWPSLNESLRVQRFNVFAVKAARADYERTFLAELARQGVFVGDRTPPRFRVRAVFTRYSAGELDDDNLRGGAKTLRDTLRVVGLIRDDSRTWLEADYRQEKCKPGEGRATIELFALGEPQCMKCGANVLDCRCKPAARRADRKAAQKGLAL